MIKQGQTCQGDKMVLFDVLYCDKCNQMISGICNTFANQQSACSGFTVYHMCGPCSTKIANFIESKDSLSVSKPS